MTAKETDANKRRVMMLGTFGFRPKGTMSARALGIAGALRDLGWDASIATVPWDNIAESGRRGAIDGVPYANTRFVRPLLWPLPVAELIAESRHFTPDVIHLFKPKGFGDLAARWLHRGGDPVVVDMDDWEGYGGWNDVLPYSRLERSLFDWQERSWAGRGTAFTVASRTLRQRVLSLGVPEHAVHYVANGLSDDRIAELRDPSTDARPDLSAIPASDRFNILLYTRFVEFDPQFVARVVAAVSCSVPEMQLVIAGTSADGQAEQRLSIAARDAGVSDQIVNLGWIHPEHLGHIAQRCAVALVPFDDTIINRAKCSVKLLELLACGIPIVASNVGENREYLDGGRVGILARPGDVESHAMGLIQIAANPGVSTVIRDEGPKRVELKYRWCALAPTVLDAYIRALE